MNIVQQDAVNSLRRYSLDIKIAECDENSLVGATDELIQTGRVAGVETGKVGRRERTVRRRLTPINEATFCNDHGNELCTQISNKNKNKIKNIGRTQITGRQITWDSVVYCV